MTNQKSHTFEEDRLHLRISFWHLLMNLKNNYLLKNRWIEPIKNVRFLIYKMLCFLSKEKNTMGDIIILHQYTKNPDDIIYSFWDIEYHKLILAIMSHFLLFYPPKTPKNQIVKKWKNCRIYFTHVHQISHPYDARFLKFGVRWRNFFSIMLFFALPSYPFYLPGKPKFWKDEKGTLEMSSFYTFLSEMKIIWCTVPEIWSVRPEFFVILDQFLPFCYPLTPNNLLLKPSTDELKKAIDW